MIAASATSNAPWNYRRGIESAKPDDDGRTQRAGPYRQAIVAVPMLIITEVRTPARITGAASGSSTLRSRSHDSFPSLSQLLSR